MIHMCVGRGGAKMQEPRGKMQESRTKNQDARYIDFNGLKRVIDWIMT